ncbi:hypothetical protein V8C86DRAFT_2499488 [Haematococcus lacustris]
MLHRGLVAPYGTLQGRQSLAFCTARRSARMSRTSVLRAGSDRDMFTLTPFELVDRQLAAMDREMDMMSRQMEQDMSSMLGRSRQLELEAQREAQRALREAERITASTQESWSTGPNLQIKRSEQRGVGSYSYYESISINNSGSYALARQPVASPGLFSPLLLAATLTAAAWALLAAQFARNVHLTKFSNDSGWRLGLMWPVLLATSPDFRQQFWCALRGQKFTERAADAKE